MQRKTVFFLVFMFCIISSSQAQAPKSYHTGEILLAIKKLNLVGSALYLAAHPDDENTALIAYLANDQMLRTGYLALTRGDGGQNLIGAEQRELMGLIRTQELLQARRIDGGEQFFTRANDFGYSKNPKETFSIWERELILKDVVWVIRNFKPDVIITRFPPTSAAGHGHHTASAILAEEAFDLIADENIYPEQLQFTQTWQAKRLLWNAYSRRNGRFTNQPPDSLQNKSVTATLSTYNVFLGKKHTVIASESRSMHKSQGFGSSKNRSERIDNLAVVKGEPAQNSLIEGIDLTWSRVNGGGKLTKIFEKAYQDFEPEKPYQSIPKLLEGYAILENLLENGDDFAKHWAEVKIRDLKEIIPACLGLWFETNTQEFMISPLDSNFTFYVEAVQNSPLEVNLEKIEMLDAEANPLNFSVELNENLANGKLFYQEYTEKNLLTNIPISQPYWLINPPKKGIFQIDNELLIGKPENSPSLTMRFYFSINNQKIYIDRPITYKWRKADEGELYRPLEIVPPVMLNLENKVFVFGDDSPKEITLTAIGGTNTLENVEVKINLPEGWKAEPKILNFEIAKGQEIPLRFQLTPPKKAQEGKINLEVSINNQFFENAYSLVRIQYPHIPIQTVFPDAEAKLVKLDLEKNEAKKIGYIEGAGDDIPQSLRQIDYEVDILSEKELKEDLEKYDAIIVGVRAFNIKENRLQYYHKKLLEYVKNGGVLIVQYHTPWRLTVDQLAPYPFEISRGRVTVEEAPVSFVNPEHPLLNYPNKITEKDFEGWVQERGLYFAENWSSEFETVLSSQDPEEDALEGGLLYAKYGEGIFIYTGYSFFRELPAGVAGAYRLFVNMISSNKG